MSDDEQEQAQVHVRGRLITVKELTDAGVHVDPTVNLPTVENFYLDDDDAGLCRMVTRDELRPIYADNPVYVAPIQPDWLTLEIENEPVLFTYGNGASMTTTLGSIDYGYGAGAARYRKSGGIAYPTDEGGNVVMNATTMPRLAQLHVWALEQMQQPRHRLAGLAVLLGERCHPP
jgi:hypothetical protein